MSASIPWRLPFATSSLAYDLGFWEDLSTGSDSQAALRSERTSAMADVCLPFLDRVSCKAIQAL